MFILIVKSLPVPFKPDKFCHLTYPNQLTYHEMEQLKQDPNNARISFVTRAFDFFHFIWKFDKYLNDAEDAPK